MELTVSHFKAKCLAIVEDIVNKKERVMITRYGRPAAEVIPFAGPAEPTLFGRSAHSTRILGELNITVEVWNAEP